MKELYVYDFDRTLIPFDSLNKFLKGLMRISPVRVGFVLALRVLRLMSAADMKKRINRMAMENSRYRKYAQEYAKAVINEMKWTRGCPSDGMCLIISASPACYMKYVGELLGAKVVASDENKEGIFVNMYGKEKMRYLSENYPSSEYVWKYATSDSESDLCWMKMFIEYELVKR